MKMLDTNMILRFLLEDNKEMSIKVQEIIQNEPVVVTNEVIAETVYVLSGVYKATKAEISQALIKFIDIENVRPNEYKVLKKALTVFADYNIDFVDCLLYAYYFHYGYEICTFDKKLNKLIEEAK